MVRLKNRYLLLHILYPASAAAAARPPAALPRAVRSHRPSPAALTPQALARLIRDGVAELFGDYGAGMVAGSLAVKYLSTATSTAIVRVARAHYRLVWAALAFVTALPAPAAAPCVVQVVRVSGTIRKAEEEAVRRARASALRARRAAEEEEAEGGEGVLLMAAAGGAAVRGGDGREGDARPAGIEDEDVDEPDGDEGGE